MIQDPHIFGFLVIIVQFYSVTTAKDFKLQNHRHTKTNQNQVKLNMHQEVAKVFGVQIMFNYWEIITQKYKQIFYSHTKILDLKQYNQMVYWV